MTHSLFFYHAQTHQHCCLSLHSLPAVIDTEWLTKFIFILLVQKKIADGLIC